MNFETTLIYIYKGNPNATYIKSSNGQWSICNESTTGYIALNDPDGKRKAILDNDAVVATKYRYPGKDSIYLKNSNGEWFISNSNTNGFIKINDPSGDRTKTINAGAIEISQANIQTNQSNNEKPNSVPQTSQETGTKLNLENLIEMALSDNELTEKEIEVLKRKAVASGYDEDEFEIMLDAKLHKFKQANITTESIIKSMPKETIHDLFEIISIIENEKDPEFKVEKTEYKELKDVNSFFSNIATSFENDSKTVDAYRKLDDWKNKQYRLIINYIKKFPISEDKHNLLEFLTFAVPLSIKGAKRPSLGIIGKLYPQAILEVAMDKYEDDLGESEIINADSINSENDFRVLLRHNWKLKSELIIKKARVLFSEDKEKRKEIENFAEQLGIKTERGGLFGFFS